MYRPSNSKICLPKVLISSTYISFLQSLLNHPHGDGWTLMDFDTLCKFLILTSILMLLFPEYRINQSIDLRCKPID